MDYLNPTSHLDEEQLRKYLFNPLDRFLCGCKSDSQDITSSSDSDVRDGDEQQEGENKEPEQIFKEIYALNAPPAQCGKLFRMGEPTYSCRDCGHDPTCVLCVNCFKESEHRFHRYKMSTSSGGGYCDCGDPEAWSQYVHCSTHVLGIQQENSDPLAKLPTDIQDRAKQVFTTVLQYAYDMLTTETPLTLPSDLTYKDEYDTNLLDLASDPLSSIGTDQRINGNDSYATVVFNDEIHNFDEVIGLLPRAVDCDRNMAKGLAHLIDREGRCLVKCCGFNTCQEVKKSIERQSSRRGSRSLKVAIMHSNVVAHQTFALRLLLWLQYTLDKSSAFRALFSKVVLEKPEPSGKVSRLENFLRHDTLLWKAARSQMHHLLISGMLLENETKRAFAEIFTRCYGHIIKDFIMDDHEHSFSVSSLSVQLYTVPTLAHHLIGKCDVLAILLRTFMSECERKKNDRGKLEFQRNLNVQGFKRASYIIYDLKYLLTTLPSSQTSGGTDMGWNNELRKGFLHGFSLLVDILYLMQGMDLQVRQITHHVEYELEWESAFTLHTKLAAVSALILQWCGTDRIVFIKAVRMLFKKLFEDQKNGDSAVGGVGLQRIAVGPIAGHTAACVEYQVSSKPVSMHQPLTRLLAGLSLHMEKFGLDWNANEFDILEKPTPVEMMEPSLRTLVLTAQVQAGMWRRNGYSVVDQVRIYHDPRCRKEMLDQDVVMLQLGAALTNPNEYMINLINKFQLTSWADTGFDCAEDESVRQLTTLAEEFLSCLITIVSERYIPGIGQVTSEDSTRRDIIHLLCEEPMSHSALSKSLAEDIHRETGMDKVVKSVATFKKPSGTSTDPSAPTGKGVYELKPEFYSEYNVFYYHYTKEEQSRSEESQRKRTKAEGLPECNPPPLAPKLTEKFSGIASILKCDVYLYTLSLVLERADNLMSRCFSENQVHRVLHLIGLSLLEEERSLDEKKNKDKKQPGMSDGTSAKIDEDTKTSFDFTTQAAKFDLFSKLERLVGSQRIESHKHLLSWVIKKWRKVAGNPEIKTEGQSKGALDKGASNTAGCEDANTDPECERKRLAAERRKKIMAQMALAQKNFMKENATLFDDGEGSGGKEKEVAMDTTESNNDVMDDFCMVPKPLLALGPKRTAPVVTETNFTCILCQEEDKLQPEGKALVMASFVQKSNVLSNKRNTLFDDSLDSYISKTEGKQYDKSAFVLNLLIDFILISKPCFIYLIEEKLTTASALPPSDSTFHSAVMAEQANRLMANDVVDQESYPQNLYTSGN